MRTTTRRAALAMILALAAGAPAGADGAAVPRVKLADVKKDLDLSRVVVIDVRSAESYRNGHIPGALNVPVSSVAEHVARLKAARKPIVAYCA
jgi:3-mercaptopyruvate sulfurtransferase SseA